MKGKTTRNIDKAVQILFTHDKIYIPTRHEIKRLVENKTKIVHLHPVFIIDENWNTSDNVQKNLYKKIVNRLNNEHTVDLDITKTTIEINHES